MLSRVRLPGTVVQALLNMYVGLQHWRDILLRRVTTSYAPPTAEIAEKSHELMQLHYDMPLSLFCNFLGKTMKYSMGLWERGATTLEEAQTAMMDDMCEKARIRDGQKVLDLGCGFGSFCGHALRKFPHAQVWGLTLSHTQAEYIRAMQKTSDHPLSSERFHLLEGDFNEMKIEEKFDRVVSVGVFEHISNPEKALARIHEFIQPRGKCFVHYIVYRPHRKSKAPPRQSAFISRYVFPGARIWAFNEMAKHQEDFKLAQEWFLNGNNYRRTLEAWLGNFLENYDLIVRNSGLDKFTLRMWEFYLRSCISVFRVHGGRYYGNGQYLLKPV